MIGLAEGDDPVAVEETAPLKVDFMLAALEKDFGTAPAERGCDVEDEGKIYVAMGVDVAPSTVEEDWGETLGEMVGFFETEWDDEVAVEVDKSKESIAFDKSEAVVVDVFFTFSGDVIVLDGEDDVAEGVDNAVVFAYAHGCTSHVENANFVVDTGNDFIAFEVEKTIFTVARDTDTVVEDT